jgi:Acetyltransferase (GNAT) domain
MSDGGSLSPSQDTGFGLCWEAGIARIDARRGQSCLMLTVSEEKAVDHEITAGTATEAFGSKDVVFSAQRMKWLYESGFGQGSAIVAVHDDRKKVGQIALLHQKIYLDGKPVAATQLVDLFILQAYRSPQLLRSIYREVERLCQARNIRLVLTLPNEKSAPLNERLLKLKPFLSLQARIGVGGWSPRGSKLRYSGLLKSMPKSEALDLLSNFSTPAAENGLRWEAETLFNRMNDPTCDYAIHATADLLLISSSRKTRGIRHALLCGFFARSDALVASSMVRELTRAACRFWNHRIFVYAGINHRLPRLPGIPLPVRLRPPILVQLRDFATENPDLRFDRFQLIDSDFV